MNLAKTFAVLAFALTGCQTVAVGPQTPIATPVPTPVSSPVSEIPRSERAMARAFVDVVNRLEPVAERECRNRAPRLNCDFQIVVDSRPDQPANAFQTVDDNGRPIIAFTIALIADARNVDEIAFVMAHEAAHHIENHLDQQRRNATLGAVVFGQLAGVTGAARIQSAQHRNWGPPLARAPIPKTSSLRQTALAQSSRRGLDMTPCVGRTSFSACQIQVIASWAPILPMPNAYKLCAKQLPVFKAG